MEPAKIDWKNLEWRFVEDEMYEHIKAPKWFDFLSQDSLLDHQNDDEAWFCRPDCNHPKTAQDFFKSPSKIASPIGVSEISPFSHRSQRDPKLKSPASNTKFNSDGENQNPNQSTHNQYQAKIFKASAEKKEAAIDEAVFPRLKSTLSARNLFAGRDILSHITDFCNDLKRMAMKPREKEICKVEVVLTEKKKPAVKGADTSILKEKKIRTKRSEDSENNRPICVNIEKERSLLQQIRTNPPSPQCFSATKKAIPSKSKLVMETGILQEQNKQVVVDKNNKIVEAREGKALDVLWFLKPCTLSAYNNSA